MLVCQEPECTGITPKYFAISRQAKYEALCTMCFLSLPQDEMKHYATQERIFQLIRHRNERKEMLSSSIYQNYRIQEMVRDFHLKFHAPIVEKPTVPPNKRLQLRLRLIAEEFIELLEACYDRPVTIDVIKERMENLLQVEPKVNLVQVADSLADLAYVIEGMNLECGISSSPILIAVHGANMRKEPGIEREDGKILKPDGWMAPDIMGCLVAQGFVVKE